MPTTEGKGTTGAGAGTTPPTKSATTAPSVAARDDVQPIAGPSVEGSPLRGSSAVGPEAGTSAPIPTPSGLAPGAIVETPDDEDDEDDSEDIPVDRHGRPLTRQPLTEEQLNTMSRAEMRAVAHDRGYKLPEQGGRALLRESFRKAHAADTTIDRSNATDEHLE